MEFFSNVSNSKLTLRFRLFDNIKVSGAPTDIDRPDRRVCQMETASSTDIYCLQPGLGGELNSHDSCVCTVKNSISKPPHP